MVGQRAGDRADQGKCGCEGGRQDGRESFAATERGTEGFGFVRREMLL